MAEQEQDRQPDEEIVQGGPGAEPETEQAPAEESASPGPATEKVKLADTEFELPPEVALALKKEREQRDIEAQRRLSEQSQELGELRKLIEQRVPEPQSEPEPDDPLVGVGDRLFDNPDATVQEIVAAAVAKAMEQTEKKFTDLTAQQQQQAQQQQFWDSFYRDNNDLRREDDHWIVSAVGQEFAGELDPMPISQAKERLAELTRARILNIAKRGQSSNQARPVEAASPPTQTQEGDQEPQVHGSLTDTLKAKRAKRIAAKRAQATGGPPLKE